VPGMEGMRRRVERRHDVMEQRRHDVMEQRRHDVMEQRRHDVMEQTDAVEVFVDVYMARAGTT
jgi:hypothetical protein